MPKRILENTNVTIKAGFTSILILVLIFGIFSLYQLRNLTLSMTNTIAVNSEKIVHVIVMRDTIRQRQDILEQMSLTVDIFKREEMRFEFYKLAGTFRMERDKLTKLPSNNAEKLLLEEILQTLVLPQRLSRDAINSLITDNRSEKGRELILLAKDLHKKLFILFSELISIQDEITKAFIKY